MSKEYQKLYYQEHKDVIKARSKQRAETHKEEIAKYMVKYAKDNAEQISSRLRQTYLRLKAEGYYQKNKEKIKLQDRKHRQTHQEQVDARARAKRLKLRGAVCQDCGSTEKLHFHHTDYKNNLGMTLCPRCHGRRTREARNVT